MVIEKEKKDLHEKIKKLTIVNESLEKSIFVYENTKK